MPASSQETVFRIETATEGDWPWIVQGEAEIVWVRLGHERQQEVGRQAIAERVAQHVARLREEEGFPNQVFVARTEAGTPAGFVWVARTHNDATGQLEASLLSQYVAEAHRGQGLGRRLLETAKTWAAVRKQIPAGQSERYLGFAQGRPLRARRSIGRTLVCSVHGSGVHGGDRSAGAGHGVGAGYARRTSGSQISIGPTPLQATIPRSPSAMMVRTGASTRQ